MLLHAMDIQNTKYIFLICRHIIFVLVRLVWFTIFCYHFSLKIISDEHKIILPEDRHITFFIPAISIRIVRKGWRMLVSKWLLSIYSVLKNVFPFGQKNLRYPPDNTVSVGMVVPL